MKRELNKEKSLVTVIVDVSFTESINVVKQYIIEEQCPLFYSLNDDGIVRFEWFLNEENNTATLIEIFKDSDTYEGLGNKVLGSPINIRFNELFKIEKLTILGKISYR